jgi:cell division septum initiation protein DivIVA
MADHSRGRASEPASLPRVGELAGARDGLDREQVRDAFERFHRRVAELEAELRARQAAGSAIEPSGHAVRRDALHVIQAAVSLADTLERDARAAASALLARSEEQRAEILAAAGEEARQLLAAAAEDASRERREAEARSIRLLEQARLDATELTNAARADVEQRLEWARAQAAAILERAQRGAEELAGSARLDEDAAGGGEPTRPASGAHGA